MAGRSALEPRGRAADVWHAVVLRHQRQHHRTGCHRHRAVAAPDRALRRLMRRAFRIGAVLLAGSLAAAFAWQEDAGEPVLHQVVDNVVFDLSLTPEGLTACLDTTKGAKLSGQYGIKVTAVSAAEAWDEPLPKTVAVADDYFQMPLRIDLKRKAGSAAAANISKPRPAKPPASAFR